jgi:hypothetical protein
MNESSVDEGVNMITVIYRTERAERPDSVPLSKIDFIVFDSSQAWENLDKKVEEAIKTAHPIALIQSPSSFIGNECILFFTQGAAEEEVV